ncbi:hypothetical protein QVD17_03187 [Tagetes erecta]|uniref:PGG domain-containing protein n=1 Tax=Tagetes erecta TaxID=13708 RepID=A0AAD8LE36_TARER|nr:hypothetical protein QVD17_03187 [Tagetes erecta]
MAGSSNQLDASALREHLKHMEAAIDGISKEMAALRKDMKYMLASNVNVSSYVPVKLSGPGNYDIWKAQMLLLIDSQMLSVTIDEGSIGVDEYDKLVKGWIFGSLDEKLFKIYTSHQQHSSAKELWMELGRIFGPSASDKFRSFYQFAGKIGTLDASFFVSGVQCAGCDISNLEDGEAGFKFGNELFREAPETENTDDSLRRKRLYKASVEGCWWKAKSILKNAASKLEPITENGNTILHIAVEMGHNYFVEQLLEFLADGEDIILLEAINDKGHTALHIAAVAGNINAARLLIQKRNRLLGITDRTGATPWDISYDITKLDVYTFFLKSTLSSPQVEAGGNFGVALNAAILTKQYDLAQTLLKKNLIDNKDKTLDSMALATLSLTFPTSLGFMASFIYPSFNINGLMKTFTKGSLLFDDSFLDKCVDDIKRAEKICIKACCSWLGKFSMILLVPIATLYPIYQLICLLILVLHLTFSMLYFLLWKALAVTVPPIKNIEKKNREYKEACKLVSLIGDHMDSFESCYDDLDGPIILAACEGSYEIVDEILFRSPETIRCKNEEGHNVIQLAIINRSEKVYNLIRHIIKGIEDYRTLEDVSGNNLAHLAGRLAPPVALARTTGAALQLQRELIWHNEVKKLMSPIELVIKNHDMETPEMVFTREHKELLKEGENWMKTTAESCSITAALIVTVVFAAAITVPGGSQQDSGIPVLRNEFAFTVFAVSNAFSLFTAAAALLIFLSILTARFSENDFLVSLPRRLIFGLLALFLSTTTMIVAFGAILFLVFCDHRPWLLAPIFLFACLPISVIVTIKLPLLVDLIRSTYFPIFGNRTYLETCNIKRENTIFTKKWGI